MCNNYNTDSTVIPIKYLLQYIHAIAEVGKVSQHVIIDLLYTCAPRGGEVFHQSLHHCLVH